MSLHARSVSIVSFASMLSSSRLVLKTSFSRLFQRSVHLGQHFTRGSLKEIELKTPVPLAGRKYLPSSDAPGFPKFLSGPREDYPLFLKAENGQGATMKHWARRSREVIEEAYRRYERDGIVVAILFRGLPVSNEKDFSEWANNLGYEPFAYVGGTGPRNEIEQNVSEGSQEDKEYTIEPHNEMAYSVRYPKIFTMSSIKTALRGGETAMCDNRQVFAKLDPSFVEKCEKKQIRYWHFLPDNKAKKTGRIYQSWQMQFKTEDRSEVESYLDKNGYSYSWEDGSLFYWNNLPPFITHARSGERLWFNQVTTNHCSYHAASPLFEGIKLPNKKYPYHTTFGDGEEIDQELIDQHRRFTWESAAAFQWQNGDVLFLDQLILQHSRLAYESEERKVGVSLLTY